MKYTFFFDEAFHDRVIRLNKTGVLNTMVPNALDSYIGVFWGCTNDCLPEITTEISTFEEKYKKRFGLSEEQELKTQIIAKKNFSHGIRSFNRDTYDFYWDLFSLIKKTKPILQIEIISKTEYVIRQLFKNIIFDRRYNINPSTFIYSLTKFYNVYHTNELLESLFNIHDKRTSYNFRKILLNHLKCVLSEIKDIKRKQREYPALKQLYDIISKSKISFSSEGEYAFSYIPDYHGLSLLLNELNISNSDVSLIIDNEEKTFQTGMEFDFNSIEQVDSKENIQVRLSDWIAGFIGRMIYAIQNDEGMLEDKIEKINEISNNDLSTKRILDKSWFELYQKQYDLYLLIYNSFIIGHEYYWTTMTTSNCDQALLLYALIRYIASYDSFERFNSIEPEMHSEYYNSKLLNELNEYYKRIEHNI